MKSTVEGNLDAAKLQGLRKRRKPSSLAASYRRGKIVRKVSSRLPSLRGRRMHSESSGRFILRVSSLLFPAFASWQKGGSEKAAVSGTALF